MFTLFILHSRRKYYRKEYLLMTMYKITKITLPEKISSISCIKKKLNIRHITVLKVGKSLMNFMKPQINHNKIENTSHPTTRTRIRLKIWGCFYIIPPNIEFITDNKLDSSTLNLHIWHRDHTWQQLKILELSTTRKRMRLGWSQQMLRFGGEGTVLNYGVTVAKEFHVQEKFKLQILRLWSRYGLLTGIKMVLHQESVYNRIRAAIIGSGTFILVFIPLCDKMNHQCQFLNTLKSKVLSWSRTHQLCPLAT